MSGLLHDGDLWISKGKRRTETNWKNTQTTWGKLVEHLRKTQVTRETHKEYMGYTKVEQDNIKDIGGFVGGIINGGRRKKYNVGMRQLITLDLDTATEDFWVDLQLVFPEAACVYSTHKHSPRTPRFRLLMPLDREVHREEYEAIARKMAEIIGMDLFDHTTFQPERLMYWPSTPRDMEYYYQVQDGSWLNADSILGLYRDWTDLSQWCRHPLEKDKIAREKKTSGDPLEKGGIIGAFCQVHGIQDAIEKFLPGVYSPCDTADRYTFSGGSTSAGLVVYEDKWAYSHHSTDPCSEKLVNAFDLVRLHTFGDLDKDDDGDTPINRRPSQLAMLDLAVQEEAVKIIVTAEKLKKTRYDFSAVESFGDSEDVVMGDGLDDLEEYEGPDEMDAAPDVMLKDLDWVGKMELDWVGKMELDRKGNPYNTIDNILVILRNDVRLKGKFIYNAFTNRQIITGNVPWRKIKKSANLFTDADDSGLRCYLESLYKITVTSKIQDALIINFLDNSFHPVRDYIKGLVWDGVPRLDTLLIDYLAAEDNEYVRAVTRKTVVAAVTRVFRPGIKYETVLTLVGKQGLGKSTLLRKLAQPWFSDNLRTFHGKDAIEMLQGVWIVELGELSAMKKADVETIKSFVSIQVDRMRQAYGRRVDDFPRQCIFIASTNDTQPLKDQTGNRRFWPVKCDLHKPAKSVFREFDTTTQQQFLAEAYQFFLKGEPIFLNPRMERWAIQVQDAYRETDDRAGQIWAFLNMKLPENWDDIPTVQRISFIKTGAVEEDIAEKKTPVSANLLDRTKVCAAEIWNELFNGFGIDMTPHNTKFIHDILKNTEGWEPYEKVKEVFSFYGIQRSYRRVENSGK